MFVYSQWDRICKELSLNHHCILANQILDQDKNKNWIVVKHDVETNVSKALKLAKIESKYNIFATYYVQSCLLKDNEYQLKEIAALGHEVTYHYDVLDSNNGDYEIAINEFNKTINQFKEFGFIVRTVCPHGNPIVNRSGWSSNKDFFRNKEVSEKFSEILDIVVHLSSRLEKKYIYISDAAYSWKIISNIEDNDVENKGDQEISDFFKVLSDNKDCLIISTHPHRWQSSEILLNIKTIIFRIVRFFARYASKIPFLKSIMSRYYYLAKNI
tara:strand:+ start:2755 stop:3567 length:813 start_codon:yes stop_codon:yes gene_type:complete